MRCPNLLEPETLGYKGEATTIFRGDEREDGWNSILERETPRKPDFLEDSPQNLKDQGQETKL